MMATATTNRTIPSTRSLPLLGNLPDLSRNAPGFFTRTTRDQGDVVKMQVLGTDSYLLSNPTDIEKVLVTNNRNFTKSDFYKRGGTYQLLGNGLLTSDGDFWLRQRRLAQPAFHRERIASYAQTMVGYTNDIMAGWQPGQPIDAHEAMLALTLRTVGKTLFDTDVTAEEATVEHALRVITDSLAEEFASLGGALRQMLPQGQRLMPNRPMEQAIQQIEAVLYAIIAERRSSGEDHGDLLSMLLQAQDSDGSQMTDTQLRDETITIFLAGHDTTALVLTYSWMLLAQNGEAEAKLHTEVDRVLQGRTPTLADLPNLPYAEQVITEAMRLYPPAWAFGRKAIESFEASGYRLPAGANLTLSPWVVQRDPRWFAEPERFSPERWTADFRRRMPRYAYFPFGGGPRLCIGQQFALMEAHLMLTTIASRYRLEMLPQNFELLPSTTLRPRRGLKMRLHARALAPER